MFGDLQLSNRYVFPNTIGAAIKFLPPFSGQPSQTLNKYQTNRQKGIESNYIEPEYTSDIEAMLFYVNKTSLT